MAQEKTKVSFRIKKSEAAWQDSLDGFWIAATPKLFDWFRWVITLAALGFVARKADNIVLTSVVGLANFAVLFYYFAFFSKFDFRGLPLLKTRRGIRIFSLFLSSAIAATTYALVTYSVKVLIASQP